MVFDGSRRIALIEWSPAGKIVFGLLRQQRASQFPQNSLPFSMDEAELCKFRQTIPLKAYQWSFGIRIGVGFAAKKDCPAHVRLRQFRYALPPGFEYSLSKAVSCGHN